MDGGVGLPTPLKWAVALTIFNGALGLIFGPMAIERGEAILGFYNIAASLVFFACAWGLVQLRPWARSVSMVLSGGGWLMNIIINHRIDVISTQFVVFLILAFSSQVKEAFDVESPVVSDGPLN